MGGYQIPGQGSGDDGYDEEGYDESQRAEILEVTRDGPTDGNVLIDLVPDLGNDDDDDELSMTDDELGEEDGDAVLTPAARNEDEVQSAFDDGDDENDEDEIGDADEDALEP